MSTKTRREKRNAMAQRVIETDWLWSCPPGMRLGEIGELLGFTGEPRTELSAHAWVEDYSTPAIQSMPRTVRTRMGRRAPDAD